LISKTTPLHLQKIIPNNQPILQLWVLAHPLHIKPKHYEKLRRRRRMNSTEVLEYPMTGIAEM
jgi:hypothetical protein